MLLLSISLLKIVSLYSLLLQRPIILALSLSILLYVLDLARLLHGLEVTEEM
jgi:hypothetical protein